MRPTTLLPLLFLSLTACNSYNLRYAAQPQPSNAHLFADYIPLQNATGFSIDTDGQRLEDVFVKKSDASIVRPLNIAYPEFGKSASIGTGLGWGIGHLGVGTGVGIPIGPERARGLTTATFANDDLGPPPWELHVKVQGVHEASIPGLGGPATAK